MKKYAVISMDVEDWYHTYFPDWDIDRSSSLLDGLDVCLDIMGHYHIHGSFFVICEIASQLREKLRMMDANGHDIACHGNVHLRPLSFSAEEFEAQLKDAKLTLEHILGHPVHGYRAPSFAIDDSRLDIVEKCGFIYDSSKLKPQKSQKYGALQLPGFTENTPCIHRRKGFTEFEVSTQRIGNFNMLLGGGYMRMLPWFFMEIMLKKYLRTGKPYILYIHPIDLSNRPLPHVKNISIGKYLRTHIGRRHMKRRFIKIIEILQQNGYEFTTLERLRTMQDGDIND